MNYIAHLNKVLNLFVQDLDLSPPHISLYMALFREWNFHRFSQKFQVQRKEVMSAAKIGSNTTYYRCITDLHNSRYINYKPSKNPHKGSVIQMSRFKNAIAGKSINPDPSDMPDLELYSSTSVRDAELYNSTSVLETELYSSASVPVTIYKHINKKERRPLNEHEVIQFFLERNQNQTQALKFFRHYEANHWITANKDSIKDWRTLAETWIINDNKKSVGNKISCYEDHLKTVKNKNYDEPL